VDDHTEPVGPIKKHSYTVPCSSRFREQVTQLALSRHSNIADLARSVVLVVPLTVIEAFPDPGGPARDDRETVVLKSGNSKGKPWRRKPRLQVRMAPGFAVETIRKALALALAIDRGHLDVGLESESQKSQAEMQREAETALMREALDELERLRNVVKALQFDPMPSGVTTRDQALYVLGFPPGSIPDQGALRTQFRRLATVYHPDGKDGSHQRMSQLNAAMEMLRRGGL
jgi:hypothetical protein